ncbi:MAPEG family protein [Roseateles oligotrophus]|uniref:Microsomal glutathione S-transferase 1 n=1 Tax=Roseateles oligotrophus TaxID=1769250 RepID=A0ABT2YGQ2_9BURK|nr:MAPEG family protein [Roseateles oligotrophus]MCV2369166.1 MAPEG family protein [Roseateles oligotrophus]
MSSSVLAYTALPAFTLALVALFTKTTLISVLQVVSRVRAGIYPIPEDARLMRRRTADAEADFVRRCANVWRNDTENLPLFFALAFAYTLLGAPAESAAQLFGAYVLLRYAHTVVFLLGLQPWRTVLYLPGLAVCWVIAWKSLLLAGLLG